MWSRATTFFARRIIGITGSSSSIVHRPAAADDPAQRCPDISLARAQLGWQPAIGLDEGLRRTAAWFRQRWAAGLPAASPVRVPAEEDRVTAELLRAAGPAPAGLRAARPR